MTTTAPESYDEMLELVDRLIAEFAGIVPAGSVIRRVSRVRWYLIAMGVHDNLLAATESAVRTQLTRLTRRAA
ncbi:MAG TPA: hypothetical protein VME70_04180 [Mycobacteriales bacterium]|nr:hypothetical protein [Mycobacteriales bacterium]